MNGRLFSTPSSLLLPRNITDLCIAVGEPRRAAACGARAMLRYRLGRPAGCWSTVRAGAGSVESVGRARAWQRRDSRQTLQRRHSKRRCALVMLADLYSCLNRPTCFKKTTPPFLQGHGSRLDESGLLPLQQASPRFGCAGRGTEAQAQEGHLVRPASGNDRPGHHPTCTRRTSDEPAQRAAEAELTVNEVALAW
jgi:hypothetical protein